MAAFSFRYNKMGGVGIYLIVYVFWEVGFVRGEWFNG